MANTSKVRLNRQLYSFELELQFFLSIRIADAWNTNLRCPAGPAAFHRSTNLRRSQCGGPRLRQVRLREQDLFGQPQGRLSSRSLRRMSSRLLRSVHRTQSRLRDRTEQMPEGSADRIELGHLGQARRAVERPADGRFPLVRLLPIQSGRIFRTGRRCRSPARRSTLLRHRLQQQIAPPGGRNGRIHRNGLDGSCCWAVRIAGRYGERDADGNSQRYRIHCRRRNDDNGCPFRQITDPSSR